MQRNDVDNLQDDFPPIRAIFFTIFDKTQGPVLKYQAPVGSISTSSRSHKHITTNPQTSARAQAPTDINQPQEPRTSTEQVAPLFPFSAVQRFIIPSSSLCDRLVICNPSLYPYQVLSYPTRISAEKYERNALMFNLAFVFDRNANVDAFKGLVRKCSRVLTELEVSDHSYKQLM